MSKRKRKDGASYTPSMLLYIVELKRNDAWQPTRLIALDPERALDLLRTCSGGEFQVGIYKRTSTVRKGDYT